ncbi:MAG: hypothetical protein ACFFB2_17430 [Promethearchaeota archaeon]
MIHSVYLIHESGICLFVRTYRKDTTDVDLLSGYLLSISQFAKQMMGDAVREIRLEKQTIVYDLQETIMFAIVTSGRKPSKRTITEILIKLNRAFMDMYGEHLQQQIIEPDLFGEFGEAVDQIIRNY